MIFVSTSDRRPSCHAAALDPDPRHNPAAPAGRMLAWICPAYGGPELLTLAEQAVPTPGRHQLLVRVEVTTVESGDVRIRSQQVPRGFGLIGRAVFGWRRPRRPVLGSVLVGSVAAVGPGVQGWITGERVVATTGMAGGAHAQWAVLNEKQAIVRLPQAPTALTAAQAAAVVFGGLTAQHFLDRAAVRAPERLLVIGATGSVGSALVQLARARGAEVTALSSASNLALARELGATQALDYRQQPLASLPAQSFDVVADTCAASSFAACLPLLRPHGRYLNIAGDLASLLARPHQGRRSIGGTGAESADALRRVLDLAAAGVLKPLIDSIWPFSDLPAAHARAGSGLKRGCVVVQVAPDEVAEFSVNPPANAAGRSAAVSSGAAA